MFSVESSSIRLIIVSSTKSSRKSRYEQSRNFLSFSSLEYSNNHIFSGSDVTLRRDNDITNPKQISKKKGKEITKKKR